jgi:class 3 adenylate cyclase/tetratricopeptide (TPR) repeat protein
MRCPTCHHESAAAASICEVCGGSFEVPCQVCGTLTSPAHRFCEGCGAELVGAHVTESVPRVELGEKFLASPHALVGERKQITVLFADVKSSMELLANLDPEDARRLLDPLLEQMIDAVHRYGGTVNQVMGDGIMALFGAPIAYEDHALRGCCAALRIQEGVTSRNRELTRLVGVPVQVRVGLNSGEVVVRSIGTGRHLDYSAVGQATFMAARMEQAAAPGTILVTADVVRLAGGRIEVKPLGPVPIKGLKDSRDVFELLAIIPGTRFAAKAERGLTQLVGRAGHLEALGRAVEEARGGHGQLVALVGDAGVGKSRIVWELLQSERARGWRVLTASAKSYARDTVHVLIVELLRNCFGIKAGDDERAIRERITSRMQTLAALDEAVDSVLALLEALPEDSAFRKLEAAERGRRTLDGAKTLLVSESRFQPLMLVLEDLHWIDSGSRVFLDSLVEALPGVPLLVVATFRPEYQSTWANRAHCSEHRIEPLTSDLARELLDALLGDASELRPLKVLLVERCDGNPFFLEESVRTLVEEKVLQPTPDGYRLEQSVWSVRVPASVQAVLTARIDRLNLEDKELLQSAAVIGREVPSVLLQAIAGRTEDEVRRGLARLCEGEFVYRVDQFPEPVHVFKHALTHEVAYDSMLRDRRRTLHARIVESIERRHADRLTDQVERLSHHAQRGEVWDKAIAYLRMGGAQAYARGALGEAIERYEAALAIVGRLPASADTARCSIDLRLDLHAPLVTMGRTQRIGELYRDGERLARELGDTVRLGRVLQRMSQIAWLGGHYESGAEYAREALAVASTSDDAVTRLNAHYFLGLHRHAVGDYHAAIPCFEYLVEGRDAHLAPQVIAVTTPVDVPGWSWLAFASVMAGDLGRAELAAQRAASTAEASGFPQARVIARTIEAIVRAYAGQASTCVSSIQAAVEMCERIRFFVWLAAASSTLGLVLARAGQAVSALPHLERGVKLNEQTGVRAYHAQRYSWWAEGLLRAGRLEEATAHAQTAVDLAGTMHERGVEAEALLVRALVADALGRHAEAQEGLGLSLAISTSLAAPLLQAHGHVALARVLARSGDQAEARRSRDIADAVFKETGARPWWPS